MRAAKDEVIRGHALEAWKGRRGEQRPAFMGFLHHWRSLADLEQSGWYGLTATDFLKDFANCLADCVRPTDVGWWICLRKKIAEWNPSPSFVELRAELDHNLQRLERKDRLAPVFQRFLSTIPPANAKPGVQTTEESIRASLRESPSRQALLEAFHSVAQAIKKEGLDGWFMLESSSGLGTDQQRAIELFHLAAKDERVVLGRYLESLDSLPSNRLLVLWERVRSFPRLILDYDDPDHYLATQYQPEPRAPSTNPKQSTSSVIIVNPNDARDRFIYESMIKGMTRQWIMARLKNEWEPLTTEQSITAAARRYASRHSFQWPIKRT